MVATTIPAARDRRGFVGRKSPRVGVLLLLLTPAYGLTGYLLSWDKRAYRGTVVTTQIASKTSLLGPYLPATLQNGLELLAPQFIAPGQMVRVGVATGKYVGRVRPRAKKF